MTAVVGILNKKGVAIAADSAATVSTGKGSKVYNSVDKIFMLSAYHPIGMVVYEGADFMGIPWETLIKEYGKSLGSRCYPTVEDYQKNFLEWLKQHHYFADNAEEDSLDTAFNEWVDWLLRPLEKHTLRAIEERANFVKNSLEKRPRTLELSSAQKATIRKEMIAMSWETMEFTGEPTTDKQQAAIIEHFVSVFLVYLERDFFLDYTGLVFVGYGDRELFPRILSIQVTFAIGDQLRYRKDADYAVTHSQPSRIVPFAQKDVVHTILQGISPETLSYTKEIFEGVMREVTKTVKTAFEDRLKALIDQTEGAEEKVGKEFGAAIRNTMNIEGIISPMTHTFHEELRTRIVQTHVNPMINTVSQLSKEDLAEMAGSLIYMTYLKRRFSMQEESVGGPVDVAMMTKGDGFIWIKRKHYFDPQLNSHFLSKHHKLDHYGDEK